MRARTATDTWLYFKLYPGPVQLLDAALTDVVKPLLDEHGHVTRRWFFLRYVDMVGPHIRLRLLTTPDDADRLAMLRHGLAQQLSVLPRHRQRPLKPAAVQLPAGPMFTSAPPAPRVQLDLYEPEFTKWGGLSYLPVAETLFQTSSEIAIALLGHLDGTVEQRLAVGLLVTTAVLQRLSLSDDSRAAFLDTHFRWWSGARDHPGEDGQRALLDAGRRLAEPVTDHAARLRADRGVAGLTAHFADELVVALRVSNPEQKPLFLVFHHLHLMLNRIGVVPVEEAVVSLLVRTSGFTS